MMEHEVVHKVILGEVALAGVVFAATARWVRSRFDSEGLILATIAVVIVLAFVVALLPPLADEFRDAYIIPRVGATVAVLASAFVIDRLARADRPWDPLWQIVAGAAAFVGGAFVGMILGLFLGVPVIG